MGFWDFLKSGSKKDDKLVCPYCSEEHEPEEVFFRCRAADCQQGLHNAKALLAGVGDKLKEQVERKLRRTVFRPRNFDHKVPCVHCGQETYLKICPNWKCLNPLPTVRGHSDMLTIVGLPSSGKTCYTLSLLDTIDSHLGERRSYRMTLSYEDDAGLNYVANLTNALRTTGEVPGGTSKDLEDWVQAPAIHMSIRLPRWVRQKPDANQVVATSLVFHDPAGEWFRKVDDAQQINFLTHTRSVMVLVDPLTFKGFKPSTPQPRRFDDDESPAAIDPALALKTMAKALRNRMDLPDSKKIPMDLALVITKADCGLFEEDDFLDALPRCKAPYDPAVADEVSDATCQRLDELKVGKIISAAENDFRSFRVFPVSALGTTPREVDGVVKIDPKRWKPKRVEDPFLWIMHKWGVL